MRGCEAVAGRENLAQTPGQKSPTSPSPQLPGHTSNPNTARGPAKDHLQIPWGPLPSQRSTPAGGGEKEANAPIVRRWRLRPEGGGSRVWTRIRPSVQDSLPSPERRPVSFPCACCFHVGATEGGTVPSDWGPSARFTLLPHSPDRETETQRGAGTRPGPTASPSPPLTCRPPPRGVVSWS